MAPMTIGEIARATGTGIETVRFYERRGLLLKPARTRAGYRQYSADAVRRLRFIVHAKSLGFSLAEIKELLALRITPTKSCADVRDRARHKIGELDARIAALVQMKQALKRLAASCTGTGPASACPLADALELEEMER